MPAAVPGHRLYVEGRDVAQVEIARTARSRARGLLGRDGVDGALWLPKVHQVHTFRMRFAIDVAFLSRSGRVSRVATLVPGRVSAWLPRAAGVLEAEAGALGRWGVQVGARVDIVDPGHSAAT